MGISRTTLAGARGLFLLLLALGASTLCGAAPIVVGTPADSGTGNAFPFGGSFNGEYQQVYSSSLFSGPILITGLEFFDTQSDGGGTALTGGTFTISLSITSADWDTLSGTLANNIGADETEVFSGTLAQPWAFGDTLSIPFSTPFTYTPGPGANLLLNVVVSGASEAGGLVDFDTNGYNSGALNGNTIFGTADNGTVFSIFPTSDLYSGYGLVTGFETPEPATFGLFGGGLMALEIVRLRRKQCRFRRLDRLPI
jgi:hypothetical protein